MLCCGGRYVREGGGPVVATLLDISKRPQPHLYIVNTYYLRYMGYYYFK